MLTICSGLSPNDEPYGVLLNWTPVSGSTVTRLYVPVVVSRPMV